LEQIKELRGADPLDPLAVHWILRLRILGADEIVVASPAIRHGHARAEIIGPAEIVALLIFLDHGHAEFEGQRKRCREVTRSVGAELSLVYQNALVGDRGRVDGIKVAVVYIDGVTRSVAGRN